MNKKTAIIQDLISEMELSQDTVKGHELALGRQVHYQPQDIEQAAHVEVGYGKGLARAFFMVACYLNDNTIIEQRLIDQLLDCDDALPTGWSAFQRLREHRRDDDSSEAWHFESTSNRAGYAPKQLELLSGLRQH